MYTSPFTFIKKAKNSELRSCLQNRNAGLLCVKRTEVYLNWLAQHCLVGSACALVFSPKDIWLLIQMKHTSYRAKGSSATRQMRAVARQPTRQCTMGTRSPSYMFRQVKIRHFPMRKGKIFRFCFLHGKRTYFPNLAFSCSR